MVARYRIGFIFGLISLLAFPIANSFAGTSPTGHEIAPELQSYWEQSGGLAVFGYAILEPLEENGRSAQYFERQRFELHPELAGTPYHVLLGLLGVKKQPHEEFTHRKRSSHGLNFGDAGVSFRESLALFGFPISEEFVDPDSGLLPQYFE